jgi:hypothetical protein
MSEHWEKLIAGANVMSGDGEYQVGTREEYEAFVKVRNKSLGQARMRDLVQQAKANQPYECSYTKDDWLKTFAELIVKECAEVAGCNGHVSGFALGDLIKQHFGVEE